MPLIQQRQEWYEDITPLAKGIDLSMPPEILPGQAALELDWYHSIQGELHKCLGRMQRDQLDGEYPIVGMYMWYRNDNIKLIGVGLNVPDMMLIHTTRGMWRTFDFINFELLEGGLTGAPGFYVDYAQVIPDDIVMFCDGIMLPRFYTGTALGFLTLPTDVSDCFFIKYYKRRTLIFNVYELGEWQPNRFWFSEPETYQAWDVLEGAGFLEWAEGGDQIVRVVEFNDTLVMFKRTMIGVITHTAQADIPFRITTFYEALGTIYPWSVDVTPFGVIYLAQDGVRIFDGQKSRIMCSDILRTPRFG